jgi:HPt (histidine-containing phosphotransfer) domain-containing protein
MQVYNEQTVVNLVGNDQALIEKFKYRFIKQLEESIDSLLKCYQLEDCQKIKLEAHFLKSSAQSMGAEKLQNALVQLEKSAEQQQLDNSLAHINLLNRHLQELKLVFNYD